MIDERFRGVAARCPDSLAVIDGEERITYRELARRKASFLGYLRNKLNLAEGELVAVLLPNCWQFAAGFFAVAEAGATFMPLNTQWRAEEIGWFMARLPVSAVITVQELLEPWTRLGERISPNRIVVVDDARVRQEMEAFALKRDVLPTGGRRRFGDQPVVYLATSGSSGRPRIVPRSHQNLLAGSNNVAAALGISEGMRFLSVVPFHHANGFSNCMLLPLLNGAVAVLMRKFAPAKVEELIPREKVQVLIAPPFIFSMLADHGGEPRAYSSVEISLSSGAPMSRGLADDCVQRLGLRVRQLYGSSETGTVSIESGQGRQEPGSVGAPLASVEVRVIASDGSLRERDETGEIMVRSPAMMAGYAVEPELNAGMFRDGFFRTGDLGRLDEQGNLFLSGRAKRIINVAGIKVDPAEIERVLESMPDVRQCRALAFRTSKDMEAMKVLVVMRPGRTATRRDIILQCRKHLAEHKIPRVIEFVDEIPANLLGKEPVEWKVNSDDIPRA